LACGGGSDAAEKQVDALRLELTKLRAETAALSERLDAVELSQGTFRGGPGRGGGGAVSGGAGAAGATGAGAAGAGAAGAGGASAKGSGAAGDDRPSLSVVRLAPDGSGSGSGSGDAGGEYDDSEDAPRPVLRSVGGGGVIEERSAPAGNGAAALREYDRALELWRSKSYDRAIEAFTAFLARYPDHANADNAVFWRGECYLAKGEARRAAEQFEAVVTGYPKGNKVPDALLQLSRSYAMLGETAAAEEARKKLRSRYPSSDAAKKLDKPGQGSSAPKTQGVKP
jgi:tol-pal system protein YbgF